MRKLFKNEPTSLDENIDRIMHEMTTTDPTSPEYKTLLDHCTALNELKTKTRRKPVSTDTMITAGASVLGILIIVAYEHAHVVVSKGLGFVQKA